MGGGVGGEVLTLAYSLGPLYEGAALSVFGMRQNCTEGKRWNIEGLAAHRWRGGEIHSEPDAIHRTVDF